MTLLTAARLIASSLHLDATPARIIERLSTAHDIDWPALVHHADGHTLTPMLYDTWRQAGALEYVPADLRDRMAKAYADNAARNINIRADLLDAHRILTEADVPHIVLKGWPLAERLYSEPAHRFLSDLDFLVPAGRARTGHRALRAAGFQPLPAKDEWIEKHLPSLWRNDGYDWDEYLYDPDYPRPVELHLRLWERGWRGLRIADLPDPWAGAQTRIVAGLPMQVLSPEDTVIHLAMHFSVHLIEREARLNQLLDLARFVCIKSGGLDWERGLASAASANISRFVYASLFLAHEIFGSPLPPPFHWDRLRAHTPPRFRVWLEEHGAADALTADYRAIEKGMDYRLTFLAAGSLSERLGILRFAALPPMGQLAAKYHLRHRWMAPLLYPRHLAERSVEYGRTLFW